MNFREVVKCFEELSTGEKKSYYKLPVFMNEAVSLIIIFWSPASQTRPHSHDISQAEIWVLQGSLSRSVYHLNKERKPSKIVPDGVDEILFFYDNYLTELPGEIHQIANNFEGWTVSLHKFTPGLSRMWVYDLENNLKWPVAGDEDTLGEPPKNAGPIWPS